jgi:hypothetical protein
MILKLRLVRDCATETRGPILMAALAWLLAAACCHAPADAAGRSAENADRRALHYETPGGVEFVITDDGLSEIHAGKRTLANGGWSLFNAEGWFEAGSGRVNASAPGKNDGDKILAKSIEVLDGRHARRFMQEIPKNPVWKESPDAFFYRNRITPLVPTNDFFRGDAILKLQSQALDAVGIWNR